MDTVPSWPYWVGEEVVAVVSTGSLNRLVSELRLAGCLGTAQTDSRKQDIHEQSPPALVRRLP